MWREEVDLRARALKRACEATVSICLDHRGVHVTVATHRSRVTEESRSAIDGAPLAYNRPDPLLPDIVVCRKDLAPRLLATLAEVRQPR